MHRRPSPPPRAARGTPPSMRRAMRPAVAAALLAAPAVAASHAPAAGRPSGAALVRFLGKQAIPALAPKSSQLGALVRLPSGVSASSLGLDAVAPGIGRLRGGAPSIL